MTECSSGHCVTCSDEGVAMTVVHVGAEPGLALCASEDGVPYPTETALVEPVSPGDRLLVHAGVALVAEIGEIVEAPAGMVLVDTAFGGRRVMDQLVGDPLPRIC